jgi:3-hydroxybutyrate dehydrogenase
MGLTVDTRDVESLAPVAIVTGASRGLGHAIAAEMGRRGYRLLLTARNAQELDGSVRALASGSQTVVLAGDVSDERHRGALVDAALDHWGRIDVLVNNAAAVHVAPFERADVDETVEILRVNLEAPALLSRAVLPVMLAQRSGRILNISSTFGLAGAPYLAAYSASKAGLGALGRSLRIELRRSGCSVTTAYPGPLRGETMLERIEANAGSDLPWMPRIGTTAAARRALRAMERGRAEVVIARGGRLGVASRAVSETATRLLGINRALATIAEQRYPAPPDTGTESHIHHRSSQQ